MITMKETQADPQKLYKKMLGDFMLHCFFTVKTDESQLVNIIMALYINNDQFFEELQNKQLDLSHWEHLHNFNLAKYQGEVDVDLTPEQEQLVDWVRV